jgi:hypothetical protein
VTITCDRLAEIIARVAGELGRSGRRQGGTLGLRAPEGTNMKRILTTVLGTALATALISAPVMAEYRTHIGVKATEWSSNTPAGTGIYPVGGDGQVNGEFVVGKRKGIQIGIRAQKRFEGLLEAKPRTTAKGWTVGVYRAETGFSDEKGRATWNYDLHVDLRNAKGRYAGKTLADYRLKLDSNISQEWFGCPFQCNLVRHIGVIDDGILFQTSQNPRFGNPDFDATAATTYYFKLVLQPKTFKALPIKARMRVVVSDPA